MNENKRRKGFENRPKQKTIKRLNNLRKEDRRLQERRSFLAAFDAKKALPRRDGCFFLVFV